MYELSNRSNEQWAFLSRKDLPNSRLAVFIRGFLGNYLKTWGDLPDLIQKNAAQDADFSQWDFLFLGYSTKAVASYLDISALVFTEWQKASRGDAPYGHVYEKLALFGHSLGTLGIRQALCERFKSPQLLKAVHSVTLFGTPLNGSPWALFATPFYKIADALRPTNPQLRMLKVWSEGAFNRDPWPKARVVLGQGDWVVGQSFNELAQWPGDDSPQQTTLDHSALSKPDTWSNCAVTDYIRSALK